MLRQFVKELAQFCRSQVSLTYAYLERSEPVKFSLLLSQYVISI